MVSLGGCKKSEEQSKSEREEGNKTVSNTDDINEKESVSYENTAYLSEQQNTDYEKLQLNENQWNYDAENDVYWQIGVIYCSDPETEEYESLGIYVPGVYFIATENDDGTYTCVINPDTKMNGYTALTAPIVMPVNTAGYSAQKAPSSYSYQGLSSYLEAGFIYVYAGCRGRSNGYDSEETLTYSGGAPWGVTDLKAAVRYLRYNADLLPGDMDRIFTFGHSGGGAQSSLMGTTGDSELYLKYLNAIGAAMYDKEGNYISDAICGAMCWCPITSLDTANEAYEWMMGQYSDTGTRAETTFTNVLSEDLAEAYADYINALGLKDEEGIVLMLSASEEGIYTTGSYYDYLLDEIENSLNHFLSDTEFPYTTGGTFEQADGGFAGGGFGGNIGEGAENSRPEGGLEGEPPEFSGDFVPEQKAPDGSLPESSDILKEIPGEKDSGRKEKTGKTIEGEPARGTEKQQESVIYETAQEYIDALNKDEEWIQYDAATNTASIISVEAFVKHCKNASKSVGAFDDLNRSQAENKVFGDQEQDALHFDAIMAQLLEENQENYAAYLDWDATYAQAYQEYKNSTDVLGTSSEERQNMYNPMYYLMDYYDGYQTSAIAPYWRIRTGISQGDTSLTVEMNLALALEQYKGVESVDFETVWEQGHTTAERTGDSTSNFIAWVNECLENQ